MLSGEHSGSDSHRWSSVAFFQGIFVILFDSRNIENLATIFFWEKKMMESWEREKYLKVFYWVLHNSREASRALLSLDKDNEINVSYDNLSVQLGCKCRLNTV